MVLASKAVFIWVVALSFVPLLIWFERKGSAFIQDRVGPNRASLLGLRLGGFLHNITDVIKLLTKELFVPAEAHGFYYRLAPFIGFTFILVAFAVIPFADNLRIGGWNIAMYAADLNAGILYILAITSLNIYGIVLAGWASNNKFSLLGGLRSSAQMISYELPLGLSIIGIFMVYSSASLSTIVTGQGELLFGFLPRWGVFVQPLGFLIFLTAVFAESNRNPFDLPEGESEIVAGYHVEYSGMRFALFYMGEYVAIVLSAALIATLFFGGWQIPYVSTQTLIVNALTVLRLFFVTSLVLAIVAVVLFLNYSKHLKGTWGDKRDREGDVLAAFSFIMALILTLVMARCWNMTIPDWGTKVVAASAQFGCFVLKVLFFAWLFIWVRWTLPRFRYDQLMRLGWKNLVPLSFLNIFATGIVILLIDG